MSDTTYLYSSERLGLRPWRADDIDWLARLCADAQVMEYFPNTLTKDQSQSLLNRLISMYDKHGYTYFAVELLETKLPIGFIGIALQDYLDDMPPFIDIGWRLIPQYWGRGLATEGARATLTYAHQALNIREIYAVATIRNLPSINVMKKIGMTQVKTFLHPKLSDYPEIEECVLYGSGVKN